MAPKTQFLSIFDKVLHSREINKKPFAFDLFAEALTCAQTFKRTRIVKNQNLLLLQANLKPVLPFSAKLVP